MSNYSLLQSYSANVIINCFRKMLLLKKIFDKRWPIAASNWTCQSQIMYANGLNSWNCRGFSGKSMSFEKQVKSFFHAFFFFFFLEKDFLRAIWRNSFSRKKKNLQTSTGFLCKPDNRLIIDHLSNCSLLKNNHWAIFIYCVSYHSGQFFESWG